MFWRILIRCTLLALLMPMQLAAGNTGAREAQPADDRTRGAEVLVRCQEALGGAERLRAIRDITRVAELTQGAGSITVKQTMEVSLPSAIRQTNYIGPREIVAFSDGTRGWVKSPWGLDEGLPEWQLRAARQDLFRQLETLVLRNEDPGVHLEVVGSDTIGTRDFVVLRVFLDEDRDVKLWQDVSTGLPSKLEYRRVGLRGLGETVVDTFEEYREVGGLRMPSLIRTSANGEPYMQAAVVEIAYNTGLTAEALARVP